MDFSKVGGLIQQIAPTLATALGGPLAGMAVKTLSSALLGNPNGSEADVAEALTNATPEQLAKLKEIDATFKMRMKELDIDLERIAAGDRADARARETKTGDWTPKVLAFGITTGFFGILVWMFLHGMPTSGTEAMLIMLGALQTSYTGVIAYYFGSSAGSKAKNDMLANQGGK